MTRTQAEHERGRIATLERRRDYLRQRLAQSAAERRPNHRDAAEESALTWALASLAVLRSFVEVAEEKLAMSAARELAAIEERDRAQGRAERVEAELAACENDRDRYAREANRAERFTLTRHETPGTGNPLV